MELGLRYTGPILTVTEAEKRYEEVRDQAFARDLTDEKELRRWEHDYDLAYLAVKAARQAAWLRGEES